MRSEKIVLPVSLSVATAASRSIANFRAGGAVQFGGTFSATVDVEVTLNGGVDWALAGTVTGPGAVIIDVHADEVRTKTTAYTSGTFTATYDGTVEA